MVDPNGEESHELARTPLHDLHLELGGRMVPFAGYEMPVQYEGIVAEHEATRGSAGLFDVAHMGIIDLWPLDGHDPAVELERLVPASVTGLAADRLRYTMFTNDDGGVIDDLIVTNAGDHLRIVVNASRKQVDLAHLLAHLDGRVRVEPRDDLALVALQGPQAVDVVAGHDRSVESLVFMQAGSVTIDGVGCEISRSGYTGEDGVEIAVGVEEIERITRVLLTDPRVRPAGLGARDTLRLEAGLCLYGNDLDERTTPVEADLLWSIQKRRRTEGGFLGDEVVLTQIRDGATRQRVGIAAEGRRPIRDGATLRLPDGTEAGTVTSGGHGPTVGGPVAMGYVTVDHIATGTPLVADVRGKDVACTVADLPFVPHRYHR
jgi:aminomethyltransferase